MKNMELRVMKIIQAQPNRKYNDLFFWRGDLTRGAWRYWTKVLLEKEWVMAIYHGHNQYNYWTGYAITEKGNEMMITYSVGDIPF